VVVGVIPATRVFTLVASPADQACLVVVVEVERKPLVEQVVFRLREMPVLPVVQAALQVAVLVERPAVLEVVEVIHTVVAVAVAVAVSSFFGKGLSNETSSN
jgi:hypothetical protein